jgi:hypothetical protein
MNIKVRWTDRGVEPQCAPDPEYPDGKHIDISSGSKRSCKTNLDYPAPRCGYYTVKCATCGFVAIITTAGRADDPRSVILPCKEVKH